MSLSISTAAIIGGKFVIKGKTRKRNTPVSLVGTAFKTKSRADGFFTLSVLYQPADCKAKLKVGTKIIPLLIDNCALPGSLGKDGAAGPAGPQGPAGPTNVYSLTVLSSGDIEDPAVLPDFSGTWNDPDLLNSHVVEHTFLNIGFLLFAVLPVYQNGSLTPMYIPIENSNSSLQYIWEIKPSNSPLSYGAKILGYEPKIHFFTQFLPFRAPRGTAHSFPHPPIWV